MTTEKPNTSTCNGCGATMTWGTWAGSGRRMPAHEDPDGNLVIEGGFWKIVKAGVTLFPPATRYSSHFATCPKAQEFRKQSP